MGFSAGRATIATTVATSATIPAPGSAPANTLRDRTTTPSGGATQTLTYGTSSGQVNVFCDGEYVIPAGSSLTLNLYDGGTTISDLTTSFLTAANLRNVKSVTVSVISGGDTGGVTVGGAASNAWAGFWASTFDVFPDGPGCAHGSPTGAAVTSSAKNLKLLNNSATEAVVVQVFVEGTDLVPGMAMGAFPLVPTYA